MGEYDPPQQGNAFRSSGARAVQCLYTSSSCWFWLGSLQAGAGSHCNGRASKRSGDNEHDGRSRSAGIGLRVWGIVSSHFNSNGRFALTAV